MYLLIKPFAMTIGLLFLFSGCVQAPIPVINKSPHRVIPKESVVKTGESIYTLSWQYGLDFLDVAKWNGLKKPYTLRAGQRIRLRPGAPQGAVTTTALASAPVESVSATDSVATGSTTSSVKTSQRTKVGATLKDPTQWRWPAKGNVLEQFSRSKGVNGIRIGNVPGSPVQATASGEVVYVGNSLPGYGNLIIIKHSESFLSAYAHNRKTLVEEGQKVKAGKQVGEMGSSGTDKTMLHFEIRRNGEPEDPLQYLSLPKS